MRPTTTHHHSPGMLNIVSGTTKKPSSDNETWGKESWEGACDNNSERFNQIWYIKTCKTSAEEWNTLRDIRRLKGQVRKVTLIKNLLTMSMGEDDTMQHHAHQECGDIVSGSIKKPSSEDETWGKERWEGACDNNSEC